MLVLPYVAAFAQIQMRDLHSSPGNDPAHVLCQYRRHHCGCYDQG
jgi:hypothetical protein